MSKYINPKNIAKEVWIFDNGTLIPQMKGNMRSIVEEMIEIALDKDFWDKWVIACLINNGKFRALMVCESLEEVAACDQAADSRDKAFFIVDRKTALDEVRDPCFVEIKKNNETKREE